MSAGNDGHVIRGLGFQNFGTHMFVNTDNNLIENNWFGLNDDGTGVSCVPTIRRTAAAARHDMGARHGRGRVQHHSEQCLCRYLTVWRSR